MEQTLFSLYIRYLCATPFQYCESLRASTRSSTSSPPESPNSPQASHIAQCHDVHRYNHMGQGISIKSMYTLKHNVIKQMPIKRHPGIQQAVRSHGSCCHILNKLGLALEEMEGQFAKSEQACGAKLSFPPVLTICQIDFAKTCTDKASSLIG